MREQHADPTANAAVGQADKEWFRMVRLAIRMKKDPGSPRDPGTKEEFTGIYRRLLDESPEDLELILKKKKQ